MPETVATGKQEKKKRKGDVFIDPEKCKGCAICVEFCPFHVLEMDDSSYNAKGYHTPVVRHRDKCTGCDICGMYCPDFAIYGKKNK